MEKNRFYIVLVLFFMFVVVLPVVMSMKKEETIGSFADLKELFDKEEKSLVYLGSATCPFCEKFNPIIKALAKEEDFSYLYLDISKLSQAENSELRVLINKLDDFGVPFTMIVGYGKVMAELPGFNEKESLKSFLVENSFIDGAVVEKDTEVDTEVYQPIADAFNGNKLQILYLGSSSCGYCDMYDPVIKKVTSDNNLEYLYVDLAKVNFDTYSALMSLIKEEGVGTPHTVIIGNGEVVGVQMGYVDEDKLTEFLQNKNVIE